MGGISALRKGSLESPLDPLQLRTRREGDCLQSSKRMFSADGESAGTVTLDGRPQHGEG